MTTENAHFDEPILKYTRRDIPLLRQEQTIQEAFDTLRREGLGEKIIYFYVIDGERRLAGVLPTRRLLTAPSDKRLADIMVTRVVAIPSSATLLEACELFAMHKLLAFPVVDEQRRVLGMVDVGLFTEEVLDLAEDAPGDDIFEALGFHAAQVRDASPLKSFRYRFPWLLATLASGTACAMLAHAFASTLAQTLLLAFFLTMVLGLGESVSMQSMTVTIQALRATRPTLRWFLRALHREIGTALLLGAACGVCVGLIVWFWHHHALAAIAIGSSIVLSLLTASVVGLGIPSLLHALRLDPKIAAGPIALALADLLTLFFYFAVAKAVLGP